MTYQNAVLMMLLVLPVAGPMDAEAQNWDTEPAAGLIGPIDGAGPDGVPNNGDDYDGTNNSPDLRGPDGIPGTDDDLKLWYSGTGSGNAGCYTNPAPNCVGATGKKSSEWSIKQQLIEPCRIETTLINTSDGEPDCPGQGCIYDWSSPDLPVFEAAVIAALDIEPFENVSGIDGPGGTNCRLRQSTYHMKWNPETPSAPVMIFDMPSGKKQRQVDRELDGN